MENLILNITSILSQGVISFCFFYLFFKSNKVITKKQHALFVISIFISFGIVILTQDIFNFSNILLTPILLALCIMIIIKEKLLKALLLVIFNLSFFAVTEVIVVLFFQYIFKLDITSVLDCLKLNTLILIFQAFISATLILLIFLFLKKKDTIFKVFNSITAKQVKFLILAFALYLFPQMLMFIINSYSYSISFIVINTVQFLAISAFLFLYTKKDIERDKAQSDLFTSELHNKTLVGMVDGVRTLKHDYNNIVQALNGYVTTKEYGKLEEHINGVLKECNVVNSLACIDPKIFNEPAIYGIVGSKFFLAEKDDITFDFDIITDISKIQFPMPDLSRIFGILLDNAIEATKQCKNPYIRLEMRYDKRKCADVIRILNSYNTGINIDLQEIYKKGVSSKKVKSGIGLWEVKKLIHKHRNSQIFATIEGNKFVQSIIIEHAD